MKKRNIVRPPELSDIDGLEAIDLFQRWQEGYFSARDRLIKYCQADVVASYLLASRLLEKKEVTVCHKSSNMLFQSIL